MQRLGSMSGDEDITKMVSDGSVASGPDGASSESKGTKPRSVDNWLPSDKNNVLAFPKYTFLH